MKILVLDIETSPSLAFIWGLFNENIPLDRLITPSHVMCFAAKWLDKKKIHFHSEYHDGREEMIKRAHALIDEADAVVHYNGKNFDMKHLNREFLLAGLEPPSPYKDIDLLQTVRQRFKFQSNKLQHVATELGLPGKKDTGGFETWKKCLEGDKSAWNKMKIYNMGDVTETEEVYYKLLPWIRTHPSYLVYNEGNTEDFRCPKCQGTELQKRGFYRTNVSVYQRYQCQNDACRSYSRDTVRLERAAIQSVS